MTPLVIDGGTPSGLPTPSGTENTTTEIYYLFKKQLQDLLPSGELSPVEKWTETVFCRYLHLCVIQIINLQPEAYPTTKDLTLIAGARQTLSAGDVKLLDVLYNMGSGSTIGKTITSINKERMDRFYPGWVTHAAADEVLFVITDKRTPGVFYVYPPQPSVPKKIKAVVSTIPAPLTAITGAFPLDDSYKPAAVDYLIYRALAEETTIPNALAKSKEFWGYFLQDLGLPANAQEQIEQKGK